MRAFDFFCRCLASICLPSLGQWGELFLLFRGPLVPLYLNFCCWQRKWVGPCGHLGIIFIFSAFLYFIFLSPMGLGGWMG